jgi:hypothetical protein
MIRGFFITLLISISIVSFAQDAQWMIYPSIGVDMGGAIPIPLSDIPEGSTGSPNLKPSLGLGGLYLLNERWGLSFDVNYHIVAFTANARVISQPYYFNDKENVLYFSGDTYTEIELRLVEFPLSVNYKLGENWSLILGGYYSVILEGKFETEGKDGWSSADKYDTDYTPLPGTVSKSYDFNDDLSDFDIGCQIGYQYKIAPRLLFWGRFHVGMKSIFVSEFEDIDYEMYQLRLSTGVSYVLFSRE